MESSKVERHRKLKSVVHEMYEKGEIKGYAILERKYRNAGSAVPSMIVVRLASPQSEYLSDEDDDEDEDEDDDNEDDNEDDEDDEDEDDEDDEYDEDEEDEYNLLSKIVKLGKCRPGRKSGSRLHILITMIRALEVNAGEKIEITTAPGRLFLKKQTT